MPPSTGKKFELSIESDMFLPATEPGVEALLEAIMGMHKVVPIAKFQTTRDAVDLTKHAYFIETNDGRTWNQNLYVQAGAPNTTYMTFSVTDKWLLEEFVPQRLIRDLVINLVVQFQLSLFKVEFAT